MEPENWKEVDFKTYCPKCKYEKTEETKDPCNECLALDQGKQTEIHNCSSDVQTRRL